MRKETNLWIKKAFEDFDTAKYDFEGKKYAPSAFWCQQAVEKALKALFLQQTKTEIPKSHSLIYLAKQTNIPKTFHPFLRELAPAFIDTRYPDVGIISSSELYDKDDTRRIMTKSKEILQWIKNQLSRNS